MFAKRGVQPMMNDTVRPSRHRQHWITLLSVPVITFSLCSFVIDPAAHAAEASKDAPPAANLPRILVLATGGTIAGEAEPRAPGAYKSGPITAEQWVNSVPGLDRLANLSAEQISSIGSQDMNDK